MSYPQEPIEHRNVVGDRRWQPRLRDGRALFFARGRRGVDRVLEWADPDDNFQKDMVIIRKCLQPRLCRTRRGARRIAQRYEIEMGLHSRYHVWTRVK